MSGVITVTVTTVGNLAVDLKKALKEMDLDEEDEIIIERRGKEILIRPINMDDILERARQNRAEGRTLTTEEVFKDLL